MTILMKCNLDSHGQKDYTSDSPYVDSANTSI